MESIARHQCVMYEGPPSRMLPELAVVARRMLDRNFRCLYLNSPPMVAGMRSYLAAAGLDVDAAQREGRLVLSSAQDHLVDGVFDPEGMIRALDESVDRALQDGYVGLWATGDMGWEMGDSRDFSALLDYECRLERLFRDRPELTGICQYHVDTLPWSALREGLAIHPAIFVNSTLSRINPSYLGPQGCMDDAQFRTVLERALV